MLDTILFSILSVVTIGAAWVTISTVKTGIPPMPSTGKLRGAVLDALEDVPPGTTVVDIGAGWGGLARRVARERPDLAVYGYERTPVPFVFAALASRLLARAGRTGVPRILYRDFRSDGPQTGACYIAYLSPEGMKWLRALFEETLPTDVRLVSCAFAMRGWTPARVNKVTDMHRSRVYVYDL